MTETRYIVEARKPGKIIRALWARASRTMTGAELLRWELMQNFPDYEYAIRTVTDEDVRIAGGGCGIIDAETARAESIARRAEMEAR